MRETEQTQRSRHRILDAAADLLVADGLGALTVDAVVRRSGVARATVYRHFPTVADLALVALQQLLPIPPTPPPGPLRERLIVVLSLLAHEFDRRRPVAVLSAVLGGEPGTASPALRQRLRTTHERPLAEPLRDAIAAGELPAHADVDLMVAMLLGPLLANELLGLAPVAATPIDAVVDAVLATPPRVRGAPPT